uniref:Uncharacterized protein n=1 Tax=Dulem virus 135 TaxID=3145612 RepID=A0AAU8AYA1_9VIRU
MEIVTFLLENLEYLVMSILAIVSIIASIVGFINKAKKKKSDMFGTLIQNLPELVSTVEALFPNVGRKMGSEKRFSVLSYLQSFCSQNGIPFDEEFWVSQIEAVLSSPQKKIKEVSCNETKKDN